MDIKFAEGQIRDRIIDVHCLLLFITWSAERQKRNRKNEPIAGTLLGAVSAMFDCRFLVWRGLLLLFFSHSLKSYSLLPCEFVNSRMHMILRSQKEDLQLMYWCTMPSKIAWMLLSHVLAGVYSQIYSCRLHLAAIFIDDFLQFFRHRR